MLRRSPLALLVLACLGLALLPAGASARPNQSVTFEAPRELVFEPGLRANAFSTLDSLGVRSLRIVLYWKNVAPASSSRVKPNVNLADPASYNWGGYDAAIQGAAARGWSVLLTVSGPVPRWATEGARDTVTRPRPKEFRTFVGAVARHYNGLVKTYSVWNEPNQPQFLLPQYDSRHRPVSPRLYRSLLLAALQGFNDAGVRRSVKVLMGETSPMGTGKVVAPLTFLRGALCLSDSYQRARSCPRMAVDGYAHHAYTTKAGPFFKPVGKNNVTIGVLSRLITALNRAARAGALKAGLPVWLTEFGIQSLPDPSFGVPQATQNEYRAISERMSWYNGRVVSFSQYLLRDDRPIAGNRGAARYGGFESGLRTANGKDKIALAGFRLPVVARRTGRSVSLWGLVRPARAATTVRLERSVSGRAFRAVANVRTSSTGAWTRRVGFARGLRFRVRWTSPTGQQFTSPAVRVF